MKLRTFEGEPVSAHPETREFPPPPTGEGQGGGDNDWDIEAFHYYFPSPPLSRKGRGSFRMDTS